MTSHERQVVRSYSVRRISIQLSTNSVVTIESDIEVSFTISASNSAHGSISRYGYCSTTYAVTSLRLETSGDFWRSTTNVEEIVLDQDVSLNEVLVASGISSVHAHQL